MATSTISRMSNNIVSCERKTLTATTGSTGNINLDIVNDGYTAVVGAIVSGMDAFVRVWVASASNKFYVTVVNPNTGATINNTSVNLRYWLITLGRS